MSTKSSHRKKKSGYHGQHWQVVVSHTRAEAMRTIRAIRSGAVEEDDIDKLQNFLLFALALMEIEGPESWAVAKVNAEILSLQHAENKD